MEIEHETLANTDERISDESWNAIVQQLRPTSPLDEFYLAFRVITSWLLVKGGAKAVQLLEDL